MKAVIYLTIAMRQFVTFGGRQLRRERKVFFTDFFKNIYYDHFSGNFKCRISIEVSTCD